MTLASEGPVRAQLRPGPFCRLLLKTLDAAEGQTRRRKRDQAPDRLGLAVKRELLERAVEVDPAPEAFEGWLMEQIISAPHPGSVRAMCEQIFLDYRAITLRPDIAEWLAAGAPSDDAGPSGPAADGAGGERQGQRRDGEGRGGGHDRWHGFDEREYACTCHLPQGRVP